METMKGKIISINISEKKRTVKKPVQTAVLKKDCGIIGDAHSGTGRQVSFIGWEEVENWLKVKGKKLEVGILPKGRVKIKIKPGDFAENITTNGIDWNKTKVGDKIIVGKNIELEITQIGKECHSGCAIRKTIGDCIMPRRGIFAKVLLGGKIKVDDNIEVKND